MFEIGRLEAWDIDEELDFHIAEFLHLELRGDANKGEAV
jgi:CMP-N-acetylneuraminic acid synthetase